MIINIFKTKKINFYLRKFNLFVKILKNYYIFYNKNTGYNNFIK